MVALLFMQWVTAVHACPVPTSIPAPEPAMAAMPGCDGHMTQATDGGHLQQCKAHCEQARQVVNSTPGADSDAAPVMLAIVDWTQALRAAPVASRVEPFVRSGAAPPGSPPRYLTLLALRN